MLGDQYVMTTGTHLILMLSVDNLDSNHMVDNFDIYDIPNEFKYNYFFTVGSLHYYSNYFNTVNNPSFVYGRFYCYGTENKLVNCSWNSYYLQHCSYYEIAGVHCECEYSPLISDSCIT